MTNHINPDSMMNKYFYKFSLAIFAIFFCAIAAASPIHLCPSLANVPKLTINDIDSYWYAPFSQARVQFKKIIMIDGRKWLLDEYLVLNIDNDNNAKELAVKYANEILDIKRGIISTNLYFTSPITDYFGAEGDEFGCTYGEDKINSDVIDGYDFALEGPLK